MIMELAVGVYIGSVQGLGEGLGGGGWELGEG